MSAYSGLDNVAEYAFTGMSIAQPRLHRRCIKTNLWELPKPVDDYNEAVQWCQDSDILTRTENGVVYVIETCPKKLLLFKLRWL